MALDGWRAQAAAEGAMRTPRDALSAASYSSDGDAGGTNGPGALGSRSSAMRELRERIQRERQQLQELETQLSHRKPATRTGRPSLAGPGSVGTLRISPDDAASRSGGAVQPKMRTPAGVAGRPTQENLFPSRDVGQVNKSHDRHEETGEEVRRLREQLRRVEEEQRTQASKIFDLDRTLDACRLDVGDLKQMLALHTAAAQRHDSSITNGAAHPQGGTFPEEECADCRSEEAARDDGEPGDSSAAHASSRLPREGKGRRASRGATPVEGGSGVSPVVLLIGVPLVIVVMKQHRAGFEEWVRQVQAAATLWLS